MVDYSAFRERECADDESKRGTFGLAGNVGGHHCNCFCMIISLDGNKFQ